MTTAMKLSKMDASKIAPGLKVTDDLRGGSNGVIIGVDPTPVEGIKSPQGPLLIIDFPDGRQQKIRHIFADTLTVPN